MRLYHSVAQKIVALIDSGIYPPGSRLPSERDLAARLGVSRVTIREAEIALETQGRLHIRNGSGVYVLDAKALSRSGLPQVSAMELTEARLFFEGEAAALAAEHIEDETLQQLECYLGTMAHAGAGIQGDADQADRDFHLTIASVCGNAAIKFVVESLWKMRTDIDPMVTVHQAVGTTDYRARNDEHSEILDALRSREPAAARLAMRRHFRRLLESMLDVTEEQAYQQVRNEASRNRERFLPAAQ